MCVRARVCVFSVVVVVVVVVDDDDDAFTAPWIR